MSQINNVNVTQVQFQQDQINTRSVEQTRSSRIGDVVQHAEAGEAQPPRVHRSAASIVGRVFLGIVTAGISEAVIAVVNAVRDRNLEQTPEILMDKNQLAEDVRNGRTLPDAYQAAMGEALAKLKEDMGGYLSNLPKTLGDLTKPEQILPNASKALKNVQGELTPEKFKDVVFGEALKHVKNMAMLKFCRTKGLTISEAFRLLPGLQEKFNKITNVDDFTKLLVEYNSRLDACPAFLKKVSSAAEGVLAKGLGERLGINPEVLRETPLWNDMLNKVKKAGNELTLGASKEQINAPFKASADSLVQSMGEAFDTIDRMDIPQALKDNWKNLCLETKNFHTFCQPFVDAVKGMDALFKQMVQTLADSPTAKDITPLLLEMMQNAMSVVPDQVRALGVDPNTAEFEMHMFAQTLEAAFAFHPELSHAIQHNPDLVDAVTSELEALSANKRIAGEKKEGRLISELAVAFGTRKPFNGAVLSSIAGSDRKEPAPLHRQALKNAEKAVRDAAGIELPDNMMAMKLPSGQTVAEALSEAVKNHEGMISVDEFGKLARQCLCQIPDVSNALTEKFGGDFEKAFVS